MSRLRRTAVKKLADRQMTEEEKMVDLKSMPPALILDVLGRACPYPIVLIKKEMEKLPAGSVLKILCDSQSTAEEAIPRYCEKHAYLFDAVKLEDAGYWECYIQKA